MTFENSLKDVKEEARRMSGESIPGRERASASVLGQEGSGVSAGQQDSVQLGRGKGTMGGEVREVKSQRAGASQASEKIWL